MDLYLRKVDHPQAHNSYRVILKTEGDEFELGSIGLKKMTALSSAWHWGIDGVVPMRSHESEGFGKDRADCMRLFKAAWEKFAADPANLTDFLDTRRRTRR